MVKEKLQQYALIAEIVSAVAIVLSLIFVGVQVRMSAQETAANSVAIEGSVRQAMLDSDLSLLIKSIDYPYLANPTAKELNELESNQLFAFMIGYTRTRETYWLQFNNNLLDEETYETYINSFVSFIGLSTESAAVWKLLVDGKIVSEEFAAEVDKRVQEFQN